MGGPGSGRRWHYGAKRSTADELRLDVRALHRKGLLKPNVGGSTTWTSAGRRASIGFYVEGADRAEAFRLAYTINGEPREQRVRLEWTACHYGGVRPWALCPRCGRRIAVLYGGRAFACRQCRDLAYASTRQDRADRLITKAQRIRMRLGGSPDLTQPFPWKPSGMHWRTYWRLRHEAEGAELDGLVSGLQKILGVFR